ncbi:MAG: hypothetical protein GWN56_09530 [Nitrosopumilaceae archaeon]|nr:hypothetical protein [Nitrosopumilaceae archaeon]
MKEQISLKKLEKINKNQPTSFNLKNFARIAHAKLNPDISTLEGLKQFLTNWYCFQYGVTEKDDKLLSMTVEELIILYQMHRIKEDPEYYNNIINPSAQDSYEEWLKKEMGDEYVTEEENVSQILKEQEDYTKKIRDQFPDKVTTDFDQFRKEE